MIKTLMGLVLIIFASVGAKTLFTESIDEFKHIKTQFTNWRNKECKIKYLCKHSYSLKYLWISNKEACLECHKCNKVKRIRLDDKSFEIFMEAWIEGNKCCGEDKNEQRNK